MVKLASILSRLNPTKVMVIGDLLVDTYTIGKARRISPEAPVAVVTVQHEESRPGGSGNVVLNLLSLGSQVVVIGRIGKDWAGDYLCEAFRQEGVDTTSIFVQENYRTPVKNRIIAENQQIVRVDHEQTNPLPENLEQAIIESIPLLMKDIKVVAISDYGKGFLTSTLLNAIISHAREKGILVISDPKGHDFAKYSGSTLIKPNLSEAYAAANLPPQTSIDLVAKKILQLAQSDFLMITRSEAGISLFNAAGERSDFPVEPRQVKDVTGAGDTVLAMLTYALANQLTYTEAVQLCNVAAGIAIERLGCARVNLSDLAHRLLEMDINNKVFDEEHLFAIQEVLKTRPFNLLGLTKIDHLTPQLYQVIKRLAKPNENLLIYILDPEINDIFIEILSSLKEVDFILLDQKSVGELCRKASPQESFSFDGTILTRDCISVKSRQN